jgi:lipopolysaccharide/colanic/teichoic acid biosynthesis glycosyltransferase
MSFVELRLAAFGASRKSVFVVVAWKAAACAFLFGILALAFWLVMRPLALSPLTSTALLVGLAPFVVAVVLLRPRAERVALVRCDSAEKVPGWLVSHVVPIGADADLAGFRIAICASSEERARLSPRAAGTRLMLVSEYVEKHLGRVALEWLDPRQVWGAAEGSGYRRIGKRAIDLALAALAAPFVFLILMVASCAILLIDGRPIFFAQDRVGRNGKVFRMLKLRTMGGRPQGGVATVRNDPRVTPLGRTLRRFRIDELPQFWHVIRGEMSIVGPRPEQPELASKYASEIEGYAIRESMLPGLTGWSQVRFGYAANADETRTKLSYDLYYVKFASFWLDAKIAFHTVGTIVFGAHAR